MTNVNRSYQHLLKASAAGIVCSLGCTLLPALATAQDVESAPAASASADSTPTVEDIIVTAEHRESTLQKTAASIVVVSGDSLRSQGRFSLSDIVQDVPGTVFGMGTLARANSNRGTDSPAADLIFRGIRTNAAPGTELASTATSAALYVDGVYNGVGGNYDIDRVEVLLGPQGTLYGRSATSGVMAVTTKAPDLNRFTGDISVEGGSYNLAHAEGGVNVPIVTDKIALRVSGNYYSRDGFYASNGAGRNITADMRAKLLVQPTENLKAMLGYVLEDVDVHTPGVSISQAPSPDQFTFTTLTSVPGVNKSRQYWAVVDLDLGGVALTYIPAYRTWTQDTSTQARGFININGHAKTPLDDFHTEELRLHSNNQSPLQWQGGVTYYHNLVNSFSEADGVDPTTGVVIGLNTRSIDQKETTQVGAFSEATYSFTPATKLTVGLRYDYTKVVNNEEFDSATASVFLSGSAGTRTFNNVTYKVRLQHDITPDNMAYASVGTGFSPGDVAATLGAGNVPKVISLAAETLTSYEIGTKNRFAAGRLQINGALYYYNYGGFQQSNINIALGTPLAQFDRIVRPLRAYGGELEVQATPWRNGQLSANVSYIHLRQHDLPAYSNLFSFSEIEGVPPFSGNATLSQLFPLSSSVDLRLGGTVRYASAYYVTNVPQIYVPFGALAYAHLDGQATADLNATLSFGNFSVTGYVRNVTDNRFKTFGLTQIQNATASGVTSAASLSAPRTFGVILAERF